MNVGTFRTNLLTTLQARSGLQGVQVAASWLGPATLDEGIYLQDLDRDETLTGTLAPANLTANRVRLDELSEVALTCQAWHAAQDFQGAADAQDRVLVLFAEVVDALQGDPDLTGAVDWTQQIRWRLSQTPFENAWAVRLVALITVKSRLV